MISLCVSLWAFEGKVDELVAYEDEVLELLREHGAELVSRVRSVEPGTGPSEVQIIEFPSQDAFDAYMVDPRRAAMADRRDAAVARTDVQRVTIIT